MTSPRLRLVVSNPVAEHPCSCRTWGLVNRISRDLILHDFTELCTWANCARVILELSPSRHWDSDTKRLTKFYTSLGFEPNTQPQQHFLIQESMIRYPVRDRGRVRL